MHYRQSCTCSRSCSSLVIHHESDRNKLQPLTLYEAFQARTWPKLSLRSLRGSWRDIPCCNKLPLDTCCNPGCAPTSQTWSFSWILHGPYIGWAVCLDNVMTSSTYFVPFTKILNRVRTNLNGDLGQNSNSLNSCNTDNYNDWCNTLL